MNRDVALAAWAWAFPVAGRNYWIWYIFQKIRRNLAGSRSTNYLSAQCLSVQCLSTNLPASQMMGGVGLGKPVT